MYHIFLFDSYLKQLVLDLDFTLYIFCQRAKNLQCTFHIALTYWNNNTINY